MNLRKIGIDKKGIKIQANIPKNPAIITKTSNREPVIRRIILTNAPINRETMLKLRVWKYSTKSNPLRFETTIKRFHGAKSVGSKSGKEK